MLPPAGPESGTATGLAFKAAHTHTQKVEDQCESAA